MKLICEEWNFLNSRRRKGGRKASTICMPRLKKIRVNLLREIIPVCDCWSLSPMVLHPITIATGWSKRYNDSALTPT